MAIEHVSPLQRQIDRMHAPTPPANTVKSEIEYSIDLLTEQFKNLTLQETHCKRGIKRTLPQGMSPKGCKRARIDFSESISPLKRMCTDESYLDNRKCKRLRPIGDDIAPPPKRAFKTPQQQAS
jgi:hypothetical protein